MDWPLDLPSRRPARSFASGRAVGALILREMATSHGRAVGGYVWAVLEPAAGIALLSLVFALGFHAPPMGTSFALFYATGIVPFLMYLDISGKLGTAILFSKQLLAYPAVTYLDALLARLILNGLVQLIVACLIFGGVFLAFDPQGTLRFDRMVLCYAMTLALATGVGTLNCLLFTRFPVWQRLWSIANRPLFVVSCIFFTFESVPEPLRDRLWWVPTVHLTGVMRAAVYPGYDASYASPLYIFGLSLLLLTAGLLVLRRQHRDLVHG